MVDTEIAIIIVHWNTPELLHACLKSIRKHEREVRNDVVVVDNDSECDLSRVVTDNPGVRFDRLTENIGFGRACNRGVKETRAPFLLFLGPDVEFTRDNTVKNTFDKIKSVERIGALSCQLLNTDGTPQKHTFNFPRADKLLREMWYETTNHIPAVFRNRKAMPPTELEEVDMVIAHWLMVSRAAFNEAGGFPEDAFMFGDDNELNKRLQDVGYRNMVYRKECAIHHGGQSTRMRYRDKLTFVVQDTITRFCFRHYGPVGGALSVIVIFLRAVFNIMIISPLYAGRGFGRYFMQNWVIIWHYLAYQWRPAYIRRIAGG